MPEFGFTEYLATGLAIAFALSVPLTLFARFLFVRDAGVRADMWGLDDVKRAFIARQVRLFIALVLIQFVFDLVLICAFAWVLYMAATTGAREFTDVVAGVWNWVLVLAIARLAIGFPIRSAIRRVRETT